MKGGEKEMEEEVEKLELLELAKPMLVRPKLVEVDFESVFGKKLFEIERGMEREKKRYEDRSDLDLQ